MDTRLKEGMRRLGRPLEPYLLDFYDELEQAPSPIEGGPYNVWEAKTFAPWMTPAGGITLGSDIKKGFKERELFRLSYEVFESLPASCRKKGKRKGLLDYLGLSAEEELFSLLSYDFDFPRLALKKKPLKGEPSLSGALAPVKTVLGKGLWGSSGKRYRLDEGAVKTEVPGAERLLFFLALVNSGPVRSYWEENMRRSLCKADLYAFPWVRPEWDAEKARTLVLLAASLIPEGVLNSLKIDTQRMKTVKDEDEREAKLAEIDSLVGALYGLNS